MHLLEVGQRLKTSKSLMPVLPTVLSVQQSLRLKLVHPKP